MQFEVYDRKNTEVLHTFVRKDNLFRQIVAIGKNKKGSRHASPCEAEVVVLILAGFPFELQRLSFTHPVLVIFHVVVAELFWW